MRILCFFYFHIYFTFLFFHFLNFYLFICNVFLSRRLSVEVSVCSSLAKDLITGFRFCQLLLFFQRKWQKGR